MICDRERLAHFLQQLKALSSSGGFTKSDLLTPAFHLAKDGDLDLYYSPHNEYINPYAVVAISGITPGFFQMQLAYKKAAQLLKDGETFETIAYETKKAAGLSGSMRQNIIEMLNESVCRPRFTLRIHPGYLIQNGSCFIQRPLSNTLFFINRKTIRDIGRQSAGQLFSAVTR